MLRASCASCAPVLKCRSSNVLHLAASRGWKASLTTTAIRSQEQGLVKASQKPKQPELELSDGIPIPKALQAIYFKPLRRDAKYGVPVCDLQLRSFNVQNLEFFSDFAMRAAYYLNIPASLVPLPRRTERWTVPKSNFVHKKSQQNFERVTYRRLIQLKDASPESIELWLAFLSKHEFHGIGMKANVFTFESLGVANQHERQARKLPNDPRTPKWAKKQPAELFKVTKSLLKATKPKDAKPTTGSTETAADKPTMEAAAAAVTGQAGFTAPVVEHQSKSPLEVTPPTTQETSKEIKGAPRPETPSDLVSTTATIGDEVTTQEDLKTQSQNEKEKKESEHESSDTQKPSEAPESQPKDDRVVNLQTTLHPTSEDLGTGNCRFLHQPLRTRRGFGASSHLFPSWNLLFGGIKIGHRNRAFSTSSVHKLLDWYKDAHDPHSYGTLIGGPADEVEPYQGFNECAPDPEHYDVLLRDLSCHQLREKVYPELGYNYLQVLSEPELSAMKKDNVQGVLYSNLQRTRLVAAVPVEFGHKDPIVAPFVLDTGSPWAFLSVDVMDYMLGRRNPWMKKSYHIRLHRKDTPAWRPNNESHFSHLCILGMDFMEFWEAQPKFLYEESKFHLQFGRN